MKRFHYLIVSFTIIILDAASKWLVSNSIGLHDTVPMIPNLFQLVHVRNTGAAFGIGANAESRIVPLALNMGAIAVFCIVVVYALRTAVTDRLLQTGLHLILGGAIGNLIDRFRFGHSLHGAVLAIQKADNTKQGCLRRDQSFGPKQCLSPGEHDILH